MSEFVDRVLPKRLPKDDRSAIRATLRVLRAAGYVTDFIFDEDLATYVNLPKNINSAVEEIIGVDDATVLLKGPDGDSFHVRFVMGNDPTEVVNDHSWRDDWEVGHLAREAIDALNNRWYELEMNQA